MKKLSQKDYDRIEEIKNILKSDYFYELINNSPEEANSIRNGFQYEIENIYKKENIK